MRILAFSDIHNNLKAVQKLRRREANEYDALIVAGDIGSHAAAEIFDVLGTFQCPVLYVLGNWDFGLRHDQNFGDHCHHLHLKPFQLGELCIVGESTDGIDPTWESMRAAVEAKRPAELDKAREEFVAKQERLLPKIVAEEGFERSVVVTHYRLSKTRYYLPSVPLFLFGHQHGFRDKTFLGSRFVNVSALDNKVTVVLRGLSRHSRADYRNIDDGSYVVISHSHEHGFAVEPRRFDPDFSNWQRLDREKWPTAPQVED